MKPSEVIREARNVLFEKGWHQGDLEGPDGSVCVVGAINTLCNEATKRSDLVAIDDALQNSAKTTNVGVWNDTEGRTFDEVIDMLDRAEKIAEQQEAAS